MRHIAALSDASTSCQISASGLFCVLISHMENINIWSKIFYFFHFFAAEIKQLISPSLSGFFSFLSLSLLSLSLTQLLPVVLRHYSPHSLFFSQFNLPHSLSSPARMQILTIHLSLSLSFFVSLSLSLSQCHGNSVEGVVERLKGKAEAK